MEEAVPEGSNMGRGLTGGLVAQNGELVAQLISKIGALECLVVVGIDL